MRFICISLHKFICPKNGLRSVNPAILGEIKIINFQRNNLQKIQNDIMFKTIIIHTANKKIKDIARSDHLKP